MKEMKIEVKSITPEDAKGYLATSLGNRNLSRQSVEAMARDMKHGTWAVNGESIIFDCDGHLVEGHHRCAAIIKANVPVTMSIIYNAPDTWVYDNTRPRNARDQFKINGEEGPITSYIVQAIIRWHYIVKKGYSKITQQEIKTFYNNNEFNLEKVYMLTNTGVTIMRKSSFGYALLCALVCGVHFTVLKRFCEVCAFGNIESADETSAIKMREYLYTHSSGSTAERMSLMLATENAIRDFVEHNPRRKNYSTKCKPVYSNQRIIDLL